jgi:hypothetical protein
LVAALCAPLAAQDTCPHQQAQSVPQDVTYGPDQDCGGVNYRVGEFQLSSRLGTCPLFVLITPPHDQVVPSPLHTRVEVIAQQPITLSVFECSKTYLLFFTIDSTCAQSQQSNIGVVPTLLTVPCDGPHTVPLE